MAKMLVRYVGGQTFRILSEADLRDHGIKSSDVGMTEVSEWSRRFVNERCPVEVRHDTDLVWGPQNDYGLALEVDEKLERLLRSEGHFTLYEQRDDGSVGNVVAVAPSPDFPGDVQVANVEDMPRQMSTSDRPSATRSDDV